VSTALGEAEVLYAHAAAIVEHTPSESLDAFQSAADRFEVTLQQAGEAGIPVPLGLELIAVRSYTCSAATAANAEHARLYLRVAREYLDDAKNGASALARDGWKPPTLDAAQTLRRFAAEE
jgi:hypothetical protein